MHAHVSVDARVKEKRAAYLGVPGQVVVTDQQDTNSRKVACEACQVLSRHQGHVAVVRELERVARVQSGQVWERKRIARNGVLHLQPNDLYVRQGTLLNRYC